jgi:hypothetical protein
MPDELNSYTATVCKTCDSIKNGGVSDHILIAASLPRIITISKFSKDQKEFL